MAKMATIITAYDEFGQARRCDANCHDARGPDCHCICGGAFHGVGSRIAFEDRFTLSEQEVKDNCSGKCRVYFLAEQGNLFDTKKNSCDTDP